MGSPYFATTATHHPSPHVIRDQPQFTWLLRATRACTQDESQRPAGLPLSSPHPALTAGSGPTLTHPTGRRQSRLRMVSITGLDTDAPSRAREYQPSSIGYRRRPRRRSRSPWAEQPGPGTLSHPARDSHSAFASFLISTLHTPFTCRHWITGTARHSSKGCCCPASGGVLEAPLHCRRRPYDR